MSFTLIHSTAESNLSVNFDIGVISTFEIKLRVPQTPHHCYLQVQYTRQSKIYKSRTLFKARLVDMKMLKVHSKPIKVILFWVSWSKIVYFKIQNFQFFNSKSKAQTFERPEFFFVRKQNFSFQKRKKKFFEHEAIFSRSLENYRFIRCCPTKRGRHYFLRSKPYGR